MKYVHDRCGYVNDHPKHYRQCVDKQAWPDWMRGLTPMPAVSVKLATERGIERVAVTAVLDAPAVDAGQPVPPTPIPGVIGGACCKHPEQMHVADAEGFPPTCMGCPDGNDEHDWRPLDYAEGLVREAVAILSADPASADNIAASDVLMDEAFAAARSEYEPGEIVYAVSTLPDESGNAASYAWAEYGPDHPNSRAVSGATVTPASPVLADADDGGTARASETATTCTICGRVSKSLTGHESHKRAHARRGEV